MNKATWKAMNRLELTVIPVKEKPYGLQKSHIICHDFVLKPDEIVIHLDDTSRDVYKRIKGSTYWRCVGLKGYEFAILVKLSL